jgi:predicted DNA-binding transcriptional regulator AlpA
MEVHETIQLSDDQLLRIDAASQLTTLSKSCINLWVAQGKFPKPATLSKTVKVWRLGELRSWMADMFRHEGPILDDSNAVQIDRTSTGAQ